MALSNINLNPAMICRLFFTLGTAVNLGGIMIPVFRQRIMNYGSRSTLSSETENAVSSQGYLDRALSLAASVQVPHTWFMHYYVVSVASSLFWGYQMATHGKLFKLMASFTQPPSAEISVQQVLLAWTLMTVQGIRRLYECIVLTKPSQSKMWVGIWLIGMLYYIFIGISVWIEGAATLKKLELPTDIVKFSTLSMKSIVGIAIFIAASSAQHMCHVYLAGLRKYTLPQSRMFRMVLSPHYTSECLIYLAMAVTAAPEGRLINKTMLAGLGFVVSNLAVTADATKKWYEGKFGIETLKGRWRMVPYVY
ncbi:3-oxo-5-alpha-steroid 4-dehydrogenase-like protein [Bisporella sp. PMI_857]|nr:3-oxo-5-alpha-steroid 4-dehydrogenase-like protein [Bisporella sp. PMI_857]